MATSNMMKIVRKVVGNDAVLFNDKLKNGSRSIKGWGLREADYDAVQAALEAAGFTVSKTRHTYFEQRLAMTVTTTRLHVTG